MIELAYLTILVILCLLTVIHLFAVAVSYSRSHSRIELNSITLDVLGFISVLLMLSGLVVFMSYCGGYY